jgi:ribonuclease P protein component
VVGVASAAQGSCGRAPKGWLRSMSRKRPKGKGDRTFFLRTSRDIEHVKQHGRRVSTALFNLLVCKTGGNGGRIGIIVGKRLGIAVRRNRAKRVFRELARNVRMKLNSGQSLLVFPKRDALEVPFLELREIWLSTLRQHGVIQRSES